VCPITEAEWLTCADPQKMLNSLGRNPSKRKRRLFGCACCRRIWHLIPDDQSRAAVLVAERFAEGQADQGELDASRVEAKALFEQQSGPPWGRRWAAEACYCVVLKNAGDAVHAWRRVTWVMQMRELAERGSGPGSPDSSTIMREVWEAELSRQAALVRDVFGNPFRPVSADPAWLTWNGGTIPRLAEAIYDERHLPEGTLDFERLSVLADALEEGGCTDADILNHCRGPGPHVRGCWVIDLLLGKQ
jgi:hypothetical protein